MGGAKSLVLISYLLGADLLTPPVASGTTWDILAGRSPVRASGKLCSFANGTITHVAVQAAFKHLMEGSLANLSVRGCKVKMSDRLDTCLNRRTTYPPNTYAMLVIL